MNIGERLDVLEVPLHRDVFLRNLVRHLSGTLQDIIGTEDAAGFISIVGRQIGDEINQQYRNALNLEQLPRDQVSNVLVDLKRRIKGDFYVIEENDEKIVLGNRRCPFADQIQERPVLCMMTSSVFGTITAENLGYANVTLEKTIAEGHGQCRVIINLTPQHDDKSRAGIEYYRA